MNYRLQDPYAYVSHGQKSFKRQYIEAIQDSITSLIRLYISSFDHGSCGLVAANLTGSLSTWSALQG